MSTMSQPFSSPSSPVTALQQLNPRQGPLPVAELIHQRAMISADDGCLHLSPSPVIGRKRSRDEAAANLDHDAIRNYAELGEGQTIFRPGVGYIATAKTQSGTWLQSRIAIPDEATELADMGSRNPKSQKFYIEKATIPSRTPPIDSPASFTSTARGGANELDIDDFTVHLGIGWSRISGDEHIQAAARGWARFIENHFPLSNVHILLQSKGLQSYLIQSSQGYFLCTEDLRQARLVSRSGEAAIKNLQVTPPRFDSSLIFEAQQQDRSLLKLSRKDTDMVLG